MKDGADQTINTTEDSDEVAGQLAVGLERPTPRFVLLYHGDIARIGAITPPDLFDKGQWVQLGRHAPSFLPLNPDQPAAGLDDPYVSRSQATLRWVEARRQFELHPAPSARKPLVRVTLGSGRQEPVLEPLETPTWLSPGELLAVGKRALLLLDVRPWRSPRDERMGMIGETERIWKLRGEIDSIARFERPVLVLGETGAGKELVARALHQYGPRCHRPFVPVNCAALPEHLIESQLFGHKKGAFTGADRDMPGFFQEADGGTLFLDELGELPMGLQAKLLRVAQDGLMTPVGARRPIQVDVRLVAATNRDPLTEIQQGRLREDLYYRIAAHTIEVPTLRKRRWDVPLLFAHLMSGIRQQHPELGWLWEDAPSARPPIPMTFFLSLLRHPWNGNIRELQNLAEQAARLNLTPGTFNPPPDLTRRSPSLAEKSAASHPQLQAPLSDAALGKAARHFGVSRQTLSVLLRSHALSPQEPAEPFEDFALRLKRHLLAVLHDLLAQNGYNQVQLATELGLSRSTVIKLIRTLGIKRPQDIPIEEIERASRDHHGDIDAMAEALRLSPRALKLHLTRSGLDHLANT